MLGPIFYLMCMKHMTPTMTYKNHFRFGYNGVAFTGRQSDQDLWTVSYGPCEREPLRFREECIETARRIRESTDLPIWVMLSGGVDSEVVLQSFVLAQIPVTAAIMRFKDDLNGHDIRWGVSACEHLSVPYTFFDLDLVSFWRERGMEYAVPTRCVSPQLLPAMYLIDQIEGYPVMGSGECLLVKRLPPGYVPGHRAYPGGVWDLYEKEKIASWYRHLMVRGRDGCVGFFQFTPEVMLSYLLDPLVVDLVCNKLEGKLTSESSKLSIYQRHFDLESRPKYSGYEKVKEEDLEFRQVLVERFPSSSAVAKTAYPDLIEMLSVKNDRD